MKLGAKVISLLSLLTLLSGGCFVQKAPSSEQSYLDRLSDEKREKLVNAKGAQVIEIYFEAINRKDYDFVLAALSPGSIQGDSPQKIVDGYSSDRQYRYPAKENQGQYLAEYMVTFDLKVVDNPTEAWRSG